MPKYIEPEKIGIIIREEFFEPYGLSVDDVAKATGIPSEDLAEVIRDYKDITPEMDLRLTKYFGMSEGFFWGLQADYYIRLAKRKLRGKLKNIVSIFDQQARKVAVL